jgi:hypothetical protein
MALQRLLLFLLSTALSALQLGVPNSPSEMVSSAAAAVRTARDAGFNRLIVNIIIPTDPEFDQPADLDPWPGGLKQQYPIALDLAREVLRQAVKCDASLRDQVLDAEDACGLILAQASEPIDDAACILFPGCDQLASLEQIDQSSGPQRLVLLINPQFRRLSDFGPLQRSRAQATFFGRGYETAFSFEEFACRGEEVKLVGAKTTGWRAYVFLDDADTKGLPLFDSQTLPERPEYRAIEKEINRLFPAPRWARKLDEVEKQGLRFARKERD